jgi:hypothetical protein
MKGKQSQKQKRENVFSNSIDRRRKTTKLFFLYYYYFILKKQNYKNKYD